MPDAIPVSKICHDTVMAMVLTLLGPRRAETRQNLRKKERKQNNMLSWDTFQTCAPLSSVEILVILSGSPRDD